MKDNKGQALVEFVIILPILLLILLSIMDFGNILYKKYAFENDLDVIVDMYNSDAYDDINDYVNDNNIEINYSDKDNLLVINIKKDINVFSPIIRAILGKNYQINVSRSIYKNE